MSMHMASFGDAIFAENCGNGLLVVAYVTRAHDILYDVLGHDNEDGEFRVEVAMALEYISMAFELQNETIPDWKSGRDIFKPIRSHWVTHAGMNRAAMTRSYILTQALLQLETFEYGNVSRSTLSYILDLFALYFLSFGQTGETYIRNNTWFPDLWIQNSVVPDTASDPLIFDERIPSVELDNC